MMKTLDSTPDKPDGTNLGNASKIRLAQAVVTMLTDKRYGSMSGLQAMISGFHQAGYADIMQSWVGTGQNMPISASQIQQVLSGQLQPLAESAGISREIAAGHLAEILPEIIDKLTPQGQIPDAGMTNFAAVQQFLSMLGR